MARLLVLLPLAALAIAGMQVVVLAGDSNICKKSLKQLYIDKCSGIRNRRSSLLLAQLQRPASLSEQSYPGEGQVLTIREIIVSTRVPKYDSSHATISNEIRPGNTPVVPPDVPNIEKKDSLPEEKGNLGFDDDLEEKLKLFDEIFERFVRSTDDARVCCDNMIYCYQNLIPSCP